MVHQAETVSLIEAVEWFEVLKRFLRRDFFGRIPEKFGTKTAHRCLPRRSLRSEASGKRSLLGSLSTALLELRSGSCTQYALSLNERILAISESGRLKRID